MAKTNPAAMQFNCTQRAHANTLEHAPVIILGVLVTGLRYPLLACALGAAQLLGRVVYTIGYSTGDPKKRMRGNFHYIGTLGLLLGSTWTAISLIMESPGVLSPFLK